MITYIIKTVPKCIAKFYVIFCTWCKTSPISSPANIHHEISHNQCDTIHCTMSRQSFLIRDILVTYKCSRLEALLSEVSWAFFHALVDGNGFNFFPSMQARRCCLIAFCWYITVDGSTPQQSEVMNAKANSPQSFDSLCCWTSTNSIVMALSPDWSKSATSLRVAFGSLPPMLS